MFFHRSRPDCHLLRLPVRWLRAGNSQAAAPSKPGNHPAHSQDDRGGSSLCWCSAVCFCFIKASRVLTIFNFFIIIFCFEGQQVDLHPDHSGHHEAAEIQRGRSRRGHQELAHGAGHR